MKKIFALALTLLLLLTSCEKPKENEGEINIPQKSKAEEVLEGMTLSEKIYQMMFVTPESITGVGQVIASGEATKKAIETYPVGGVIYFASNFIDREQTKTMVENIKSYSKIPLFIGVDEEGGIVSRLGSNPAMGVTHHVPMAQIGKTGDKTKAYEVGKTLGEDLSSLGFNVDFAPVADVLINPNNSEIGSRSFGSDAALVADMVGEVVSGLEETGVSSCLKHFPGHGSTSVNSHNGKSESTRTKEDLKSEEFLPFIKGIEKGADFVMVSHMTLVNATEKKLPSSISKEVITGMLIEELGFSGIIITDSFSMGAITKEYDENEAVLLAIGAGTDMILMPRDVASTHDAIKKAVENGEITEERIDKSVMKILSLKYGI